MKQYLALPNARGNADHRPGDANRPDDDPASNKVALIGSEHELAQRSLRLGELEAALDKAQRRIERLLGERNQLGALLEKRDEQIQRLNRELGTQHFADPDRAADHDKLLSWSSFLPSLFKRIRAQGRMTGPGLDAKRAENQETAEAKKAPEPGLRRPPLQADYKKTSPQGVLAVVMFGLNEGDIRDLLPIIERDCSSTKMMPLILTDNDAFELLREHGLMFEYLPPLEDRKRFGQRLSWDLYIQRRLAIIRQKWQPMRVIALGQIAADMLRLWHDSPFEETPLPAVMKI